MMESEMTDHLGYPKSARSHSENCRNGSKTKTVRSKYGEFEVDVPKDRNGTFEPQIVKNRQKDISGIDDKIISMYAKGLTTRQISEHMKQYAKKMMLRKYEQYLVYINNQGSEEAV